MWLTWLLRPMKEFLEGNRSLRDLLEEHEIVLADVPAEIASDLSRGDLSYETIWAWCQLGRLFGRSLRVTPILCTLLIRDDHESHEDLADTLQDLRAPRSVDCLFDRAERRLPYLDYNDSAALARRCVWALHDIGTVEAIVKLKALASDPREGVSSEAAARLQALRGQSIGAAQPSYRLARNGKLGSL